MFQLTLFCFFVITVQYSVDVFFHFLDGIVNICFFIHQFVVFVTLCSSSHNGILSERKSINWSCEPKPHHGSCGSTYGGTQTPFWHGVCSSCGRITSLNGGLFLLGHEPIGKGFLGLAPWLFDGGNVSLAECVISEFIESWPDLLRRRRSGKFSKFPALIAESFSGLLWRTSLSSSSDMSSSEVYIPIAKLALHGPKSKVSEEQKEIRTIWRAKAHLECGRECSRLVKTNWARDKEPSLIKPWVRNGHLKCKDPKKERKKHRKFPFQKETARPMYKCLKTISWQKTPYILCKNPGIEGQAD